MMKINSSIRALILITSSAALPLAPGAVQAEMLSQILPELLEGDDEIKQVEAELEAAQHEIRVKQAGWYPTVDLTVSEGYENIQNPDSDDTKLNRHEHKLSLEQLVTDFGATRTSVSKAQLQHEKKRNDLLAKRQEITLGALQAYLNLIKNVEKLQYARRSEGNIKKQTGMEEARVARGSGYSTDVLQSKSKLASAYAKTARASGALVKSQNEFRSIFGYAPKDMGTFRKPVMPYQFLPKTLEEALEIAFQGNTTLRGANYDVEIAQKDIRTAELEFYPTITAKVDKKFKENDAGTAGGKNELKAHFELEMPIYTGGENIAGLKKSTVELTAKQEKLDKVKRDVEEKVRNAWQDLITDRTNAEFLRNSANISGEFLTLARKERKMGTRSLIDVLSEENSYINALDSAVSAETDLVISAFKLLKEIGQLDADMVQDVTGQAQQQSMSEPVSPQSAIYKSATAVAGQYKAAKTEVVDTEQDQMQVAMSEVQADAEVIDDSLNAVIRKMEDQRNSVQQSEDAVLESPAPLVDGQLALATNSQSAGMIDNGAAGESSSWDAAFQAMKEAGWIKEE